MSDFKVGDECIVVDIRRADEQGPLLGEHCIVIDGDLWEREIVTVKFCTKLSKFDSLLDKGVLNPDYTRYLYRWKLHKIG